MDLDLSIIKIGLTIYSQGLLAGVKEYVKSTFTKVQNMALLLMPMSDEELTRQIVKTLNDGWSGSVRYDKHVIQFTTCDEKWTEEDFESDTKFLHALIKKCKIYSLCLKEDEEGKKFNDKIDANAEGVNEWEIRYLLPMVAMYITKYLTWFGGPSIEDMNRHIGDVTDLKAQLSHMLDQGMKEFVKSKKRKL